MQKGHWALWGGDCNAWDLGFISFFPQSSEQSVSAQDWFRKASKSLHKPTWALVPQSACLSYEPFHSSGNKTG